MEIGAIILVAMFGVLIARLLDGGGNGSRERYPRRGQRHGSSWPRDRDYDDYRDLSDTAYWGYENGTGVASIIISVSLATLLALGGSVLVAVALGVLASM